MFELRQKLENNKTYVNSGEIFSKLLMLKEILTENKDFLILVESEKQINNYIKIANFLGIKLNILNNYSDLVNLIYNKKGTYISTKELFNRDFDKIEQFEYLNTFEVKSSDEIEISKVNEKLVELGFSFSEYENENSFRVIGDTFHFTNNSGSKLAISFWDDNIDEIIFDGEKLDKFTFGRNKILDLEGEVKNPNKLLISKFSESEIFTVLDNIDFYSTFDDIFNNITDYLVFAGLGNKLESINLGFEDLNISSLEDLKKILEDDNYRKKAIYTKNRKTIRNFLDLNNLEDVLVIDSTLNNLKSFKSKSELVITDDNISRLFIKKRVKRTLSENLDLLMQIKPGDFIVHIDHGVGIFREIIEKELGGIKKEYITLEYKNQDKLFVPITEVSRVSKYVGNENPKLTGLSTKEWEKKVKKVSEDVEQIAGELLEIFAKRKLQKGHKYPSKKDEEAKFFNSFEYVYTEDQFSVINDIYKDMESEFPMDRLLSGDVGFGKTEVAFASIFKALINNKQAALISPLVVLAYEHFEKAKDRFKDFPFNIEVITRFEKASVIKNTLEKLKAGKIDLIVGTHRLLSEDVNFKDLGLLVIDEEHKFGVKDKEKIKRFKGNIDILSMSATPIPRSLNMALNGIKQVSMLTTPPVGKQAIETIVSSFDDDLIFSAGKRELDRGGQIFFIHNRVETIQGMQKYLEQLFPGKEICVAHGQLPGDTLEKRIVDFKRKQYDILLATTVVENGIDFSNVNTIFINDSVNFGISQIHQLRGRVGRGDKQGYCYLLFKKDKIKEDAAKRLRTIVDYSHLGAGFELAVKDLEIRGGGDILGIRQSGSSVEVGISLFLEMLEDKVEELKANLEVNNPEVKPDLDSLGELVTKRINTTVDLNIEAFIDEQYFSSELDKINFYREIESIRELEDLENLISDFKEINHDLPVATINLFNLLKLKIKASKFKIKFVKKVGINYQVDFVESIKLEDVKEFLKLDKKLEFQVVNISRLRSPVKNFVNEEKFIEYLLQIFDNKTKSKIKLKKKIKL